MSFHESEIERVKRKEFKEKILLYEDKVSMYYIHGNFATTVEMVILEKAHGLVKHGKWPILTTFAVTKKSDWCYNYKTDFEG